MGEEGKKEGTSSPTVVYGAGFEKPKNIIDVVSDIQEWAAVLGESEVDGNFFTLKQRLEFFEVGFKGGFFSGLITALFTPFAIGVVERIVPAFGSYNATLFDKIFVFVLALSFSLGYAVFIGTLGKFYNKNSVVRNAIKNFYNGFYTGTISKVVLVFLGFHLIYFNVLTPEKTGKLVGWIGEGLKWVPFFRVSDERLAAIYRWLMEFREVFIPSAYFVALSSLILICIPMISVFYYRRKQREIKDEEL